MGWYRGPDYDYANGMRDFDNHDSFYFYSRDCILTLEPVQTECGQDYGWDRSFHLLLPKLMEEDVVEGVRKRPEKKEEVEDAWDLNAFWAEPEKVAEAAAPAVGVAAAAATACVAL